MSSDSPKILLVDDLEANLVALEATLSDVGGELVKARSGNEALKRLLGEEFAVILLDVQMPGMDGFETAELVRQREKSRHTPIVFVTALNKTDAHVLKGYALGAVDYIFKPIVPEVLRSKVSVFLELFRMRQNERRIAEELARKSEELERSNADLAQFAHVAAHDLQEPLRTIASYLNLLQRRTKGKLGQDADEFVAFAVDGAQRMHALIQDLLAFARIGAQGGRFEDVDANESLARAQGALSESIQAAGATVEAEPLPTVVADPSQLARLFQNLVANGIKFRGKDPPFVHVAADRAGDEWIFSVRDNGLGIEAADRERIFRLFERLHGRSEFPGSGLGLAICKRIVEVHGGRIWVESTTGGGSVFYFALPVSGPRGRPTTPPVKKPSEAAP